MDLRNLRTIFVATGAVSVLVFAIGLLADPVWAIRYGIIAALALANWFALSRAIVGVITHKTLDLMIGLMLKPLLLVLLLVVAKLGFVEISSFLAGVNTFFVTLFGFMALRALYPTNRFLTAGSLTNG